MFKTHRLTAIAGILVLLLAAACGPAATPTPTAAPQPTPTKAAATVTPVGPAPTATKPAPTSTPAPSPTPAYRIGGKIRWSTVEPSSLDPHAIPTFGTPEGSHLFDPLVRLYPNFRIDPWLAESWDTPDPTTFVFKLRKGVKFQDGSPFNAQIAKWNFDRIMNPATVSPVGRQSISAVDKVEVVDDYTLRLKLKSPASDILYYLTTVQISMMTPTAVEKWGKDAGAHPIGTGPFIFQDWLTGRGIRMTRNPDYWDSPRPYLGEIETVFTGGDPTVLYASLLTGLLDLVSINLPQHLDRLEKTPGMRVHSAPGIVSSGLYVNHLKAPMNNLDFRRALDIGVDREAILKALLKGRGEIANTMWSAAFPEHSEAVTYPKRDVAKARELLARSGYKGEVLDYMNWPGWALGLQVSQAIQAQYKEIGINIEINNPPVAAWTSMLGQLHFDIALMRAAHAPAEVKANLILHSKGRLNSGRFGDTLGPVLDSLIDQVRGTYDWNTRKRLFDEVQKVVSDNVADVYFFWEPQLYVSRERVQNFVLLEVTQQNLREVWIKD